MTTILSTPIEQKSLPAGWRWARLDDVLLRMTNGTSTVQNTERKGVPVTRIETISLGSINMDRVGWIDRSPKDLDQWTLHEGDILFSHINSLERLGNCAIYEGTPPVLIHGMNLLRFQVRGDLIESAFLFSYLRSNGAKKFFADNARRAIGQASLNTKDLGALVIPLPPLPEQRRIAAQLSEIMADIARARAAAQAALNAAKALPAAQLRGVFEGDEAKGWKPGKIGDVCRRRNDVIHPRDGTKGKLRFVGLEHIESNTGQRLGETILDAEELDGRKPRFLKGDVLYGYLRPYLNKVWVTEFNGVSSVDQYAFEVDEKRALPQYIAHYMRSPIYLRLAPIDLTPGFLPRIRSEEVESVPIPLPPLEEQKKITKQIDHELESSQNVRVAAQSQLDAINALPAVYLRKAFRGEL